MTERQLQQSRLKLHPTYYLDNFNYMLSFVENLYWELLNEDERSYLNRFRTLSQDAQCLYIRIANRKGQVFRTSKLDYSEIRNTQVAISELDTNGFVSTVFPQDPVLVGELFNSFTKPDLYTVFKDHVEIKKSLSKSALMLVLVESFDISFIIDRLVQHEMVLLEKCQQEKNLFKVLFFGNEYGDMSQFVIRDLGIVKFENQKSKGFQRSFETRADIDDFFLALDQYAEFKFLSTVHEPLEIYEQWFRQLYQSPQSPKAQRINGKLIYKLGYTLEKLGFLDESIDVYRHSSIPKVRIRHLRALDKIGNTDYAILFAQTILSSVQNVEERQFAHDYILKKTDGSQRAITIKLRSAGEYISLPEMYRWDVEEGVVDYLQEEGWQAWHVENWPWKALFGLFFWEEIFDVNHGGIHHPLQRNASFSDPLLFYESRKKAILHKVKKCNTNDQLLEKVGSTYSQKKGVVNSFFSWTENLFPFLEHFVSLVPTHLLLKVLVEMGKNLKTNRTGFPDIFASKGSEYVLYEVKSPTDQLSAQQLFWIDFFEKEGLNAKILKIQFENK